MLAIMPPPKTCNILHGQSCLPTNIFESISIVCLQEVKPSCEIVPTANIKCWQMPEMPCPKRGRSQFGRKPAQVAVKMVACLLRVRSIMSQSCLSTSPANLRRLASLLRMQLKKETGLQ